MSEKPSGSGRARRMLTPEEMKLGPEGAWARRSANPGLLENLFFFHGGHRPVNKWIHYLPFYDRVFLPFRRPGVKMLEIGVYHGGSLALWRRYFGSEAVLYGIDIDPACADRVAPPNQVRIGSQDDPEFLRAVVAEMGGIDIVLDDGSHMASHQRVSFQTLWPLLNPGGVYVIEDMHTSYWPSWEGGYRREGTAVELVKALIDDMHGWFHREQPVWADREELGGIEITDSIAAIHKIAPRLPPGHAMSGSPPEQA